MGLQFFPRGGSAHVAGNLARALPEAGWRPRLVSGSLDVPGRPGNARDFYAGLDVHAVDMTPALHSPEPMLADVPLHPSYEDRGDAPDRIFAALDDRAYRHHVAAWSRVLRDAGAQDMAVLHLHHLTPLNAAADIVAPDVPVVAHLHGTELLMLEAMAAAPGRWPHARPWTERMRRWAGAAERLIVLSESQVARAERLLGIDPDRCVRIPNGFDPERFAPHHVDHMAFWRRHLVTEPRGWAPGGEPGSVGYGELDLAAFAGDDPVLLYIGRYTAVKRLPLLIEAYARAEPGFVRPAPLVLLGGFPGEWEGEHPLDAIRRTGARNVFLAGWHGHDELPSFLAASDVVVLPSVGEQFGQVLVEGMACGLPAIAVDSHGPSEIVDHGKTGWLVEGDDVVALANALVEAVNRPGERRRRGRRARDDVLVHYAWPALAHDVAEVYATATERELALT